MTKNHCDRCDVVIDRENRPTTVIEVMPTFMDEKGQNASFGLLRVTIEPTTFDGEDWHQVELCDACMADLVDLFVRQGAHERLVRRS